jgi:hypothetical protein
LTGAAAGEPAVSLAAVSPAQEAVRKTAHKVSSHPNKATKMADWALLLVVDLTTPCAARLLPVFAAVSAG